MKRAILSALLLLCILTSISANDFEIKSFHVDININEDGTFSVKETIDVFFNEKRRGIYRHLPYKYIIKNDNYNIRITDIKVEGEKTKITNEGGSKKIRIGHPDISFDGHKTYYINYHVSKALLEHPDAFEFYWNLNGSKWDVPIEKASFIINYPSALVLKEEMIKIFADDYGSKFTAVSYDIGHNSLSGKSTRIIKPGEGISIATMMDAEYFNINPGVLGQIEIPKIYPKDLYFPVPVLLSGLLLWFWRKKDRRTMPSEIEDKFYPPDNMSPTEVGAFYDYQVNNRDLLALIPKWGNEGLITLESIPNEDEKFDIYFHKNAPIDINAPDYEQDLFNGLFRENSVIFLEDLKNKFYKIFSKSKSSFSKDIILNHLHDQKSKNTYHNPWNVIFWIVIILFAVFLIINFHFFISGGVLVLFAILGIIMTFSRPMLSERGFKIHTHLRGLKRFLENPPADKIQSLVTEDSRYLDSIFPYVVAFGLDKKWNAKLKTIDGVNSDPTWYQSSTNQHGQGSVGFTEAFSPKSIESAFTSSPHSSSRGSSGGGGVSGSSGGGFGGGGGGSW